MSTKQSSPRGAIGAADVAADEEDWETAEAALLDALGQVRKKKNGGDGA